MEIVSLRDVKGEVVDYAVGANSRAAGRLVNELALPKGAVIGLIVRQHQIIPPHGKTRIEAGDHVILVLRPEVLSLVTRIFSGKEGKRDELPRLIEFPLRPNVRVRELEDAYGIEMKVPVKWTLAEAIRNRLEPGRFTPAAWCNSGRSHCTSGELARVARSSKSEW